MSFKITIEETRMVDTITRREWKLGGPDGKSESGEYGYTPQIPESREHSFEVLKQVVDTLDLAAVIKAINGI